MTPLEQEHADHQSARPEMPRPFVADSPEGIAFHQALQKWINDGQNLGKRLDLRNRQAAGIARAKQKWARVGNPNLQPNSAPGAELEETRTTSEMAKAAEGEE